MSKVLKTFIFFFCLIMLSFQVEGQSTFKEVLEETKGMKVPFIAEKLIGNKIFEFSDTTYNGNLVNFDSIQGKVTVINFWFINCPPCLAEMKGLNEIVTQYESNEKVKFISFSLDDKKSLEKDFFSKREFKFEVIPNSIEFIMFNLQSPFGYPTTFVVDQSGIIRKVVTGSSRDVEKATIEVKENLIPIIEELLSEE